MVQAVQGMRPGRVWPSPSSERRQRTTPASPQVRPQRVQMVFTTCRLAPCGAAQLTPAAQIDRRTTGRPSDAHGPCLFRPVDMAREVVSQEISSRRRRRDPPARRRGPETRGLDPLARRGDLDRLTKILLEHETLEEPQLADALTNRGAPTEPSLPPRRLAPQCPRAHAGSR